MRMFDIAKAVVAAAEDELSGIQHAYVSHAQPPFDCPDQFTVHVQDRNVVTQERVSCASRSRVVFIATIVRCWPVPDETGQLPTSSELEAATKDLWDDEVLVRTAIRTGVESVGIKCDNWMIRSSSPMVPEGGTAAWSTTFWINE